MSLSLRKFQCIRYMKKGFLEFDILLLLLLLSLYFPLLIIGALKLQWHTRSIINYTQSLDLVKAQINSPNKQFIDYSIIHNQNNIKIFSTKVLGLPLFWADSSIK